MGTVPLCVKCQQKTVTFFRDGKGFCTMCDPYHPIHLVRELERIYTVLDDVEKIVDERLEPSYARGAIKRALKRIYGPVAHYSKRTKGVEWTKPKLPRKKREYSWEEREAIGKRLKELRHRKRQLESEHEG